MRRPILSSPMWWPFRLPIDQCLQPFHSHSGESYRPTGTRCTMGSVQSRALQSFRLPLGEGRKPVFTQEDNGRKRSHPDWAVRGRLGPQLSTTSHVLKTSIPHIHEVTSPHAETRCSLRSPCVFRSGSYTSPVIQSRCRSTASFRATAATARFFAFFPPRVHKANP